MGFITFQGSLFKTGTGSFLVILTELKTFRDREKTASMLRDYSHAYNGIPVILAAVDPENGKPKYVALPHHKHVLQAFQREVPFSQVQFKEYKVYIET